MKQSKWLKGDLKQEYNKTTKLVYTPFIPEVQYG